MSPREHLGVVSLFFVFLDKDFKYFEGRGQPWDGGCRSSIRRVLCPHAWPHSEHRDGCGMLSSLGTLSRCSFQSNICLSSCLQHAGVQEFAFPIRLFSEIREWGGELWLSTVPGLEGRGYVSHVIVGTGWESGHRASPLAN